MPYITGFEIDGMVKATRESVIEVLETRFGVVPSNLSDRLNSLDNLTQLKQLHKQSITVTSVDQFEQILAQIIAES
jgi:hypothetical protein